MKSKLLTKVSRTVGRAGLKMKKYSPEILFVVGAVGVVTSAVKACKDTPKAQKIMEEAKAESEKYKEVAEQNPEKYSAEDLKNDTKNLYIKTGLKVAKVYAPAVILGVASLSCMFGSNHILKKRNIALAAMYETLDKSFKEYRKNVVKNFGEDLDKELKYNIISKEIEEEVINEKGETETVKKTERIIGSDPSGFHIFFDAGDPGWDPRPETSMHYLEMVQRIANDRLKSKGYLTLNEVYEMFGHQPTKAGLVNGWVYKKDNTGDNEVSFFLDNIYREIRKAENEGSGVYNRGYLIDFNIDGYIYDQI